MNEVVVCELGMVKLLGLQEPRSQTATTPRESSVVRRRGSKNIEAMACECVELSGILC